MADRIEYAQKGEDCEACAELGHTCPAYQVIDGRRLCLPCIDIEPCAFTKNNRVVYHNSKTGKVTPVKPPMNEGKLGELCACGCMKRLKPGSAWLYIRGHKQDKGGLPNENKVKSPAEMTVSQLMAKFDADIAELQSAKKLLAKYSGGLA